VGYDRLVRVGTIAMTIIVWLAPDFNCTVTDPAYVNGSSITLSSTRIQMILYVEQPFIDLERTHIAIPPSRRASRCSWTKALTTGAKCGWGASWVGRAWRSKPARRKPARFSAPAGPGRTG
jgi:hypothetical protein